MVQLESAVVKNPKLPVFTGLGVLVDAITTSSGAARVPRFTNWVTARQNEQAKIFNQRRLSSQEMSKTLKSEWHGWAQTKRAPKPKPKPKV